MTDPHALYRLARRNAIRAETRLKNVILLLQANKQPPPRLLEKIRDDLAEAADTINAAIATR